MACWNLSIYWAMRPEVGKTYAMLREGQRLKLRGTDVVIGWVQTSDRVGTMEAIADLEVVPPRTMRYRDVLLSEMDVDAIIARLAGIVLVDQLAHANVPGPKYLKRYQDVLELRAAGISVITNLNIDHLASLQETVKLLTGIYVMKSCPTGSSDVRRDRDDRPVRRKPCGIRCDEAES